MTKTVVSVIAYDYNDFVDFIKEKSPDILHSTGYAVIDNTEYHYAPNRENIMGMIINKIVITDRAYRRADYKELYDEALFRLTRSKPLPHSIDLNPEIT